MSGVRSMLKVMTIVGTRPEIIRLSRVIDRLDRHANHVLVHTGQNYDYELNQIFLTILAFASRTTFWKLLVRRLPKRSGK
jgi:UDP-N-acetylglucosamine 2-epimerase